MQKTESKKKKTIPKITIVPASLSKEVFSFSSKEGFDLKK